MKTDRVLTRGRHAARPYWTVPIRADPAQVPSDLSDKEGPRSNVPVHISDLL
jgi:hypothetical protein